MKLVPVSFGEEIPSGIFEHMVDELIDNEIDLTIFEARCRNDKTGLQPTIRRSCSRSSVCVFAGHHPKP